MLDLFENKKSEIESVIMKFIENRCGAGEGQVDIGGILTLGNAEALDATVQEYELKINLAQDPNKPLLTVKDF